jgi:hypothetical protein
MSIKLHDIEAGEVTADVKNNTAGIDGVEAALAANPMPKDLVEALRTAMEPKGRQL